MTLVLRTRGGEARPLAVAAWEAPASPTERELLAALPGPVLDVGCGPGRLVLALAEGGTAALGVDASPAAADRVLAHGASVLCRSVFAPIPGEGRWRSVLLFDGNIGIGGDPARLLRRLAALVAGSGSILVEVEPPGCPTIVAPARLEGPEHQGPWFPWAWVGADGIDALAAEARLVVGEWLRPGGRWVARLRPGGAG